MWHDINISQLPTCWLHGRDPPLWTGFVDQRNRRPMKCDWQQQLPVSSLIGRSITILRNLLRQAGVEVYYNYHQMAHGVSFTGYCFLGYSAISRGRCLIEDAIMQRGFIRGNDMQVNGESIPLRWRRFLGAFLVPSTGQNSSCITTNSYLELTTILNQHRL